MATYEVRKNLAGGPSTLEVTADALVERTDKGVVKRQLALADIRRVRLTYQAAGVMPMWYCWVRAAHGRVSFPSGSFIGFGRAQDQSAAFRTFLQAFTRATAARAPDAVFLRGGGWQRPFYFGLLIVFAVLGFLLVLGLVGSMMDGKSATWAALPGLTSVTAVGMSWRMWRSNPPATFDPNALPPDIGA